MIGKKGRRVIFWVYLGSTVLGFVDRWDVGYKEKIRVVKVI